MSDASKETVPAAKAATKVSRVYTRKPLHVVYRANGEVVTVGNELDALRAVASDKTLSSFALSPGATLPAIGKK
jgi:hypothetical protein